MCGFDGILRGNHFGGEPIRTTEEELRRGELQSRKAAGKDEVTGKMIKAGSDLMVDWIWCSY